MKQSDLIHVLAAGTGLTKACVGRVLEALASTASNELAAGGEVPLPGIGKLATTRREARTGRNPQTGEPVAIAAKIVVKLKPAKAFADSVN